MQPPPRIAQDRERIGRAINPRRRNLIPLAPAATRTAPPTARRRPSSTRGGPASGTRIACRRVRLRRTGRPNNDPSTKGGAHPPQGAPEPAASVNAVPHFTFAPHALLMVAAAARRQGPRRSRGSRRRPWRLSPLTARCNGRSPWRASRGANARGRTYQLSSSIIVCPSVPSASTADPITTGLSLPVRQPRCNCALQHPRRLRGACIIAGCRCRKYVPKTDRPQPVNAVIGRWLRRKGR